ncbi:integrase [Glaesserella sp.]|uniref:integrase n=1 Tax=Glaesserella sp. TaxID=2094731 RepID=UPI0035A159CA
MKTFILLILSVLSLSGCVNMPVASYTPQDYSNNIKYDGSANVGQFSYAAFEQGRVKSNQVENTALGSLMLEGDIAELAQRGTMLELERTGIKLGQSDYTIVGRIKEFKVDDLRFNAVWTYTINYKIMDAKTSAIILDKDYSADPKTRNKFSITLTHLINDVNEMIYSAYRKFISDHEVKRLLATP